MTNWRADHTYTATNASKTGLLDETRLFLRTYAEVRDLKRARQVLIDGGLPQRSRVTRVVIVRLLGERLMRWSPPPWVLDDLASFAQDSNDACLGSALLLHVTRQDRLIYDFVQQVIVTGWHNGEHTLLRSDVQRFLDQATLTHPEIERWSHSTREKLAGNVLSILQDYGLLRGRERRTVIEPLVPPPVAAHLVQLLRAEGVVADAIPAHPDWQLWLWDEQRVRAALAELAPQEVGA